MDSGEVDLMAQNSEEKLRADVLVCHETPSCHRNGFGAIDDLARDMRVQMVVHGHHHRAVQRSRRGSTESDQQHRRANVKPLV